MENQPVSLNLGKGFLFGLGGVVIGALAWGVVGGYLEYQAFIVAIGAGVLIAWLVTRGAGGTGWPVQVTVAVLTFLVVVLGELLSMTIIVHRLFDVIDPVESSRLYFESLDEFAGEVAFAVLGGAAGVWFGIKAASPRRPEPETQGQWVPPSGW